MKPRKKRGMSLRAARFIMLMTMAYPTTTMKPPAITQTLGDRRFGMASRHAILS